MFLSNLGHLGFFLFCFLCLSCCLSGLLLCVSGVFFCAGALFFPLNSCQPLHARQWETKIKWKNPRPVFLKNNFVQHWGSASAAQNLPSKNKASETQKCPRNAQMPPRNPTGKTEKAEKEEAKITSNCRETSKTVQLYLCEVSPNKYVWNPPYDRETKFILLKNIAKRRLPTPLRISRKRSTAGGKAKSCKGHQGPSGPQPPKNNLFLRSRDVAAGRLLFLFRHWSWPFLWDWISKTNCCSPAGALRAPDAPYNFSSSANRFLYFPWNS